MHLLRVFRYSCFPHQGPDVTLNTSSSSRNHTLQRSQHLSVSQLVCFMNHCLFICHSLSVQTSSSSCVIWDFNKSTRWNLDRQREHGMSWCVYGVLVCVYGVLVCVYGVLVCVYGVLVCVYGVLVCVYGVLVCVWCSGVCVWCSGVCVYGVLVCVCGVLVCVYGV